MSRRRTTLLAAALSASGYAVVGAADAAQRPALLPTAVVESREGLRLLGPGRGEGAPVLGSVAGDRSPALSPDGRSVAVSRAGSGRGEIVVLDLSTGGTRQLTVNRRAADADPAWSPDGKRIVWSSGRAGRHDLFVMNADGTGKRRLVRGKGNDVEPSWSPDGKSIVFASDRGGGYDLWTVRAGGGKPKPLVELPGDQRSPAWSPRGGRLAFTSLSSGGGDVWISDGKGRQLRRLSRGEAFDGRPAWSADGRSIAFVSMRGGTAGIWATGIATFRPRRLAGSGSGASPDLGNAVAGPERQPDELLPDLDQRAPAGLVVHRLRGGVRLGFASAVDNVGAGPVWIRAYGATKRGLRMRADQLVQLASGAVRTYRDAGWLEYTPHPPHFHWHYQPFERYELRRASDHGLVTHDRKIGFCLADHYGHAAARVGGSRPPRFLGDCGKGLLELDYVEQGSSVGFTDRYPAFYHGQDVDLSGVPPGLYVLVHRANPERRLHELRYDNNAASVLIRLTAAAEPGGLPAVEVLRACSGSEYCASKGS